MEVKVAEIYEYRDTNLYNANVNSKSRRKCMIWKCSNNEMHSFQYISPVCSVPHTARNRITHNECARMAVHYSPLSCRHGSQDSYSIFARRAQI